LVVLLLELIEDSLRLPKCGLGIFGTFWRIVIPLSVPGLAVTAFFAFVTAWNELLFARSFLTSKDALTLPVGMATFIDPFNQPWGLLTAIDLNTGDHKWNVTLGDTPAIRNHPLLKSLNLPPVGVAGAPGPIVTASGLIFVTGGGSTLYALDTQNGATLWSADLGQGAYSVPMTYRTSAGKQFVVIATGAAAGAKLMAFALP
jgi:glucose dehydrogenase